MRSNREPVRVVVANVIGGEWPPPRFDSGAAPMYLAVRSFELDAGHVRVALDLWNRILYSTRDGDDVHELATLFGREPKLWHVADYVDRRPAETVVAAIQRRAEELARGIAPMPKLEAGAWIVIGDGQRAVVCGPPSSDSADHLEIVYLDGRDRAINEDVRWTGSGWDFVGTPQPGYADRYDRLRERVSQLRLGRRSDPPRVVKGRRR